MERGRGERSLQSRSEKTQVRIVERKGREGQDRARSGTSSGQAREGAEWKLLLRSAVFLLLKGSSPRAQHERLDQAQFGPGSIGQSLPQAAPSQEAGPA